MNALEHIGGRGRLHDCTSRFAVLEAVTAAIEAGANQREACEMLGIAPRTVQRYRKAGGGVDQRKGTRRKPANALGDAERATLRDVLSSPKFAANTPGQIVAILATNHEYIASERTMYREIKRQPVSGRQAKPRRNRVHNTHRATAKNQVWCWDITYLRSPVQGMYYYAYLVIDVWSRAIVGFLVAEHESAELGARLIESSCQAERITPQQLVLHSDNGSAMRSSTLAVKLQDLGVTPSFSRPRQSNDNAFSESLHRTLKQTDYPTNGRFDSLEHAQTWLARFVAWYNNAHLHSGISYTTPMQRHRGDDIAILQTRAQTFAAAQARNPQRWTGKPKAWPHIKTVWLNQRDSDQLEMKQAA